MEFVLASFAHPTQYGIRYSLQGDPRITKSKGYGILTPLMHAKMHLITSTYVTRLLHSYDLDVALAWLAVQRQLEIYWTFMHTVMEDTLLCYDWNTGRILCLPIRYCREVNLSGSNVVKCPYLGKCPYFRPLIVLFIAHVVLVRRSRALFTSIRFADKFLSS